VGGPLALPASSSSRSMQQVHKVEWQRRMKPARPVVLSIICTALLVGLPGCRSGAFPHYPSNYREYAYVANGGSNTVSVLDVVDMRQQGLLTVGPHPVALVANPVRNQVYTINRGALPGGTAAGPAGRQRGSVSVIDAEQNLVKATIPVGLLPAAAAMDAGGTRLFVANAGSNNVSVVDPGNCRGGRGTRCPCCIARRPDAGSGQPEKRQCELAGAFSSGRGIRRAGGAEFL
jgi:YVTN family beta-propeller protein